GAIIAPNDGYVTKGDHNTRYDQETGISTIPVKDEWVIGVARQSIPYLGYVRLTMEPMLFG
ncbi:MAG: S26 family signal peptidase, partial [Methanosarcinales archaeon]|nr:S26 family signal peptidase [Methanosarcinales archaeon]